MLRYRWCRHITPLTLSPFIIPPLFHFLSFGPSVLIVRECDLLSFCDLRINLLGRSCISPLFFLFTYIFEVGAIHSSLHPILTSLTRELPQRETKDDDKLLIRQHATSNVKSTKN